MQKGREKALIILTYPRQPTLKMGFKMRGCMCVV